MKLILTFLIAVTVGAAQQSPPAASPKQNSAKSAAIEELLSAMKIERTQQQYITQIQPLLAQQLNGVVGQFAGANVRAKMEPDIQEFQMQGSEFITKLLDFQKLEPEYVRIYDETFSAEEIASLLNFYKSPTGQAFVDKLPVVLTKSMNLAQQVMRNAAPQIQQMVNVWVEKMKIKYGDQDAKK